MGDNNKKMMPPPPPPDAMGKSRSYDDIEDVNTKIARPEDYNEIQFKAVDPMELRRKQKLKGTGRYALARTADLVPNKPTSASTLGAVKKKTTPPPVPYAVTNKQNMIFNNTKTKKPALPSAPAPKPKPKQPVERVGNKKGVLEAMPTKEADGWVYNETGMFPVKYSDIKQLQRNNVFEGSPVIFSSVDKKAVNIRLLHKVDTNIVKECMTKKMKKTKFDAKYYIHETEFEFEGNLSCNAFEMPKDCSPQGIATMSEKIVNAFMNSIGGTLYIGIDKSWNVMGVAANSIDLPGIKQSVTSVVSKFTPKVKSEDLKKLKFTTTAVLTKEGDLCEDLIVAKIIVPGPFKDDDNEKIIFSTGKGDKFKKNLNYVIKVVM